MVGMLANGAANLPQTHCDEWRENATMLLAAMVCFACMSLRLSQSAR